MKLLVYDNSKAFNIYPAWKEREGKKESHENKNKKSRNDELEEEMSKATV